MKFNAVNIAREVNVVERDLKKCGSEEVWIWTGGSGEGGLLILVLHMHRGTIACTLVGEGM